MDTYNIYKRCVLLKIQNKILYYYSVQRDCSLAEQNHRNSDRFLSILEYTELNISVE